MPQDKYDIFIANEIYPDAEALFQFHLKSSNEIKDECYVVIDTNALLVPYTVSKTSLQVIRSTYLQLVNSGRLVIPGQVAREFARNRPNKISELYQQISRNITAQGLRKLEPYPLFESMKEFEEALELSSKIESYTREYRKKLGEVRDKVRAWIWDDPVSLVYRELFKPEVILDPSINDESRKQM
jgi:rRNA-processing protein FCF1